MFSNCEIVSFSHKFEAHWAEGAKYLPIIYLQFAFLLLNTLVIDSSQLEQNWMRKEPTYQQNTF